MKGIILAGGTGSRLYPLTQAINKQLLPIYDVPLIYFPITTLLNANIRDICIISSPDFLPIYKKLLGDGSRLGVNISYKEQERPDGIAQVFLIAEDFIGEDNVTLVLGDNIFHGEIDFSFNGGAKVYAYAVSNPQDYGVVKFNKHGVATQLVEKPREYISQYAIPGLYIYDNSVVSVAKDLKPSARGELEITDVNKVYLERGKLYVSKLNRGFVWLDAGVPSTLHQAAAYVETVQTRQGIKIACLEEIALSKGFITEQDLSEIITQTPNSEYKTYLTKLLEKH